MEHNGPAIAVINYEVAKYGPRWEHLLHGSKELCKWESEEPTYNWRGEQSGTESIAHSKERMVYRCPTCGHKLIHESGIPWTVGEDKDNEFCTDTQKRVKRQCPECAGVLWQCIPFSYGGRWPCCEFLSQHYPGQYALVIDEAHNVAGGDTNIGAASQDAVTGALHTVAMTGTMCNGYASSLFYLFYRLSPQFRDLYEHNEVEAFKDHHGYVEIRTTTPSSTRRTSAYGYTSEEEHIYRKEAPGISPVIISMMMPMTAFLRKADLGIELPPRTEIAVPIELGPLSTLWSDIESERGGAVAYFITGDRGPLARWGQAALGALDDPSGEILTYEDEYEDGEITTSVQISPLPEEDMPEAGWPKDERLINIILSELAEDRGVVVFFEQVNKRDARHRIKELLKQEGVYSGILESQGKGGPAADQRMEWIYGLRDECKARGQPTVLLCSGGLKWEGIDLLFCPTGIKFAQNYDVNGLRQQIDRNHRIGQDKEVRWYFMYYQGTKQEDALKHNMAKMRAALQIDGEVAAGIAAVGMDEDDFVQSLMREAEGVDRVDISDLMKVESFSKRPAPKKPKVKDELQLPKIELHKNVTDLPQPKIKFKSVPVETQSGEFVQFTMF